MATKKADLKSAAKDVKRLRATVEKLELKVEKLDAKAQRWKAEARRERAERAKVEARLRRLTQERAGETAGDVPLDPPDDSWTVVRLRRHARDRGVTGFSRLTKAQLLERLSA